MAAPTTSANEHDAANRSSAPSVALPRRKDPAVNPASEPLWALTATESTEAPLSAKCDRHSMPRDVCCKTLRSEDERTLIDPDVVRDMYVLHSFYLFSGVALSFLDLSALKPSLTYDSCYPLWLVTSIIGLSDGLTVPFALTAGLSSIGSSRIVVLGGVAELIAGAISMGIGGFCKFRHMHYSDLLSDHLNFLPRMCAL